MRAVRTRLGESWGHHRRFQRHVVLLRVVALTSDNLEKQVGLLSRRSRLV